MSNEQVRMAGTQASIGGRHLLGLFGSLLELAAGGRLPTWSLQYGSVRRLGPSRALAMPNRETWTNVGFQSKTVAVFHVLCFAPLRIENDTWMRHEKDVPRTLHPNRVKGAPLSWRDVSVSLAWL